MSNEPSSSCWISLCAGAAVLSLVGCDRQRSEGAHSVGVASPAGSTSAPEAPSSVVAMVRSNRVQKDGLQIEFSLGPDVRFDRLPTRVLTLRFENTSDHPLRIYMPSSEWFRANISSIFIKAGQAGLTIPEPRPHGYVVTEVDFPLLAPGEKKTFEQTFSIDRLTGPGATLVEREPGFERGTLANVSWDYENDIVSWQGGIKTLDGPTKNLFGGKRIPHIWTGKLGVEAEWRVP